MVPHDCIPQEVLINFAKNQKIQIQWNKKLAFCWRSFINSEGFIASVQGTTEETPDDDRRSEKMDETSIKKKSKIIKISKKFFQIC